LHELTDAGLVRVEEEGRGRKPTVWIVNQEPPRRGKKVERSEVLLPPVESLFS
jgi:hypothetical protein